jgi:ribosomal protein S2
MKTNTARNIIATGGHIGSPKFNWQPISERFAVGYRNGLIIYNIAFSNFYIKKALNFVERCVFDFGRVYIYGLIKQYDSKNINIFRRIDQVVCIKPWHGGFITNFRTFKKYFKNNKSFSAVVSLVHDHKNYSISHESSLIRLPIVSPVDSSVNPENFTYPIPANTVNSEMREYIALNFGIAVFKGLIRRTFKRLLKKKKKIYKKIKKKEEKRKKVKALAKKASRFKSFVNLFFGGKSKLYKTINRDIYEYHKDHWTIKLRGSLKRISSIKKLLRIKISEILVSNKKKSRLKQKLIRINRRRTKKKIKIIKYVKFTQKPKKIYNRAKIQIKYVYAKRILKQKKKIKAWDDKVIPLLKRYPFVTRKRVKMIYDVAFYAIGAVHKKPKLKVPRKYIERYRNRKLNKIRGWFEKKKFIDFKKKVLKSIKRKKRNPAARRKKKIRKLIKVKKKHIKKKKKIYKKIKKNKSILKSIKRKKKKSVKIKIKRGGKKPGVWRKRILKWLRLAVKRKKRKTGQGFLFRKEKDKFLPKHILRRLKKKRFFYRWRGKWRSKLTKRKKTIKRIKFGIKRTPKSFSKIYKKKNKRKFKIKSPKSPVRRVALNVRILKQKKWFGQVKRYKRLLDIIAYKKFNKERLRIAKLIAKKKARIKKEEKFAKLAREKGYGFLLNSKKPIREEERKFVELLGRSDKKKIDPKLVVQEIKKLLVQRINNITKEKEHDIRIRQERINRWRYDKPYYKKNEIRDLKTMSEEEKKKLTRKEKRRIWFANNKHRINSKLLWEEVESNHHSKLFRLELYH